jgi:hypothetical protein
LYELQLIDTQLDELEELRGDLPLAVDDLNNQIQGITEQLDLKKEIKEQSMEKIKANEEEIERLNLNLTKFKAQLYQVRNNKEYDALTKEIDHSEAEIGKLEADNKALDELMVKSDMEIEEVTPQVEKLKLELGEKQKDLGKIIKTNERDEQKLKVKREQVSSKVKKPDYSNYMRIRKAKAGQAIVAVQRAACSGCHNVVPAQRQIEIRQNKRLFTCESCGRILISSDLADELELKAVV